MDTNETLRELREAIGAYRSALAIDATGWAEYHAERAMVAAIDLDERLSKGGSLPDDWAYEKRAYGYFPRTENAPDPASYND